MSIISIEDLIKHEDDVLRKYPMLKLLHDIVNKYPDVTVEPCFHWYKTDNGLNVLKGYHVNFGVYTLSVQFGYGNYRTGRENLYSYTLPNDSIRQDTFLDNCIDAEIAVFESNSSNGLIQVESWNGSVEGWQTPEQIMNFIDTWIAPKLGSGE